MSSFLCLQYLLFHGCRRGQSFFSFGENNFLQSCLCPWSQWRYHSRNKASSVWNYPCYIYIMKRCISRILIKIWPNLLSSLLLLLLLLLLRLLTDFFFVPITEFWMLMYIEISKWWKFSPSNFLTTWKK